MAYTFGVATDGSTQGLIQNFTTTQSVEIGEARDANGDVYAFNPYNETEEFSAEWVLESTYSVPTVGTNITIGSNTYVLTSVVETESNTEYTRLSLTGNRYITNAIPTT